MLKKQLKNVTQGRRYITNLIEHYPPNKIMHDIVILELLQYHPTKNIDTRDIEYLIIKVRKPFNKMALYYKYKNNDTEEDISYTLCIKNLFGKYNRDQHYEENVRSAFRHESHRGSKKQYFITNTCIRNDLFYGICQHCKIDTNNITTDHFPIAYQEILSHFIKIEKIVLLNIDIYENEINEIRIKNQELAIKFLVFHDEMANYRLLCKSCNSHFGSYV